MFSPNRIAGSASQSPSTRLGLLLIVALMATSPLLGSRQPFTPPDDLALRIRLDDTLTRLVAIFAPPSPSSPRPWLAHDGDTIGTGGQAAALPPDPFRRSDFFGVWPSTMRERDGAEQ